MQCSTNWELRMVKNSWIEKKEKNVMRFIKKFDGFKLTLESVNVHPQRFRNADISDIIDFVDQLVYGNKNIDITEKIAGQHLSVFIKDNKVFVSTKDRIDRGSEPTQAHLSRWGSDISYPLMEYLKTNQLLDQTWGFEVCNPNSNHDYISYKNVDNIYAEYTGNLSEEVAEELRKRMRGGTKLLTKKDVKVEIKKTDSFENFKKTWDGGLRQEFERMKGGYTDSYKVGKLKDMLGDLLDDILVSVVDKVSPVEGIVIGTKNPIKLQTNKFLKVQGVQMPLYSVFKISRREIDTVLKNPTTSFQKLIEENGLRLDPIYKQNRKYSLYETVKYYLQQNSKLENVDTAKYVRWLTPQESSELLSRLTEDNITEIYMQIYRKAKA